MGWFLDGCAHSLRLYQLRCVQHTATPGRVVQVTTMCLCGPSHPVLQNIKYLKLTLSENLNRNDLKGIWSGYDLVYINKNPRKTKNGELRWTVFSAWNSWGFVFENLRAYVAVRAVLQQFNGTELCCAPSACAVYHRNVLCTIVHKGDLLFWEVGFPPNIFHFLVVPVEHTKTDTFCPYLVGKKDRKCAPFAACGANYMVHKTHT